MESQERIKPFLKWAGGKRWLAPRLDPIFQARTRRYFEPFLGSGAVYFHFLPGHAHLSDANEELISCYRVIRDDPVGLIDSLGELSKLEPDSYYYDIRSSTPSDDTDRAARFLYLNRTCWNGLYRVNKKGEFNVPRGTKTQIILPDDDFISISDCLLQADIDSLDFEQSIDRAEAGDIVFCDPPYTVAHNMNGFVKYNQNIFSWADQERLANCLHKASNRGAIVVLTNADHSDIRNLYEGFGKMIAVPRASVISGSTNGRRGTTELLILNEQAYQSLERPGL